MNRRVASGTTVDDVLVVVHQVVAEILGIDQDAIADDVDLRALGADSIDRVEIIVMLKGRLGVREPLAAFARIPDVRALAEFLHQHRGGQR